VKEKERKLREGRNEKDDDCVISLRSIFHFIFDNSTNHPSRILIVFFLLADSAAFISDGCWRREENRTGETKPSDRRRTELNRLCDTIEAKTRRGRKLKESWCWTEIRHFSTGAYFRWQWLPGIRGLKSKSIWLRNRIEKEDMSWRNRGCKEKVQ
jgi:hypothetical protein